MKTEQGVYGLGYRKAMRIPRTDFSAGDARRYAATGERDSGATMSVWKQDDGTWINAHGDRGACSPDQSCDHALCHAGSFVQHPNMASHRLVLDAAWTSRALDGVRRLTHRGFWS